LSRRSGLDHCAPYFPFHVIDPNKKEVEDFLRSLPRGENSFIPGDRLPDGVNSHGIAGVGAEACDDFGTVSACRRYPEGHDNV
jgi:hypothetical protein